LNASTKSPASIKKFTLTHPLFHVNHLSRHAAVCNEIPAGDESCFIVNIGYHDRKAFARKYAAVALPIP
jgi:hypothetical protein